MTIFEDLGREFDGWRTRYFDNMRTVEQFVNEFVTDYRSYIGAPATYDDPSDSEIKRPYIQLMRAVEQDDRSYRSESIPGGRNYLPQNSEGQYCVLLYTTLEIDHKTYPKQSFSVLLKIEANGNDINIIIAHGESRTFRLDATDRNSFKPAFDYIVNIMFELLKTPPNEMFRRKKSFGFTSHLAPKQGG